VKEPTHKNTKSIGERSQPGRMKTQRKHWQVTSFMVHQVTDNIPYTLLLSFFTYTHAYAPAPAYMPARIRQGGKEETSSWVRLGASPTYRHLGPSGALCVANSSITRISCCNACVGQQWAFYQSCQTGRFNRYFQRNPLFRGAWERSTT
jgi:hypothetical protein